MYVYGITDGKKDRNINRTDNYASPVYEDGTRTYNGILKYIDTAYIAVLTEADFFYADYSAITDKF